LVEVLLALIVLGLASVALLIAFSTSISASAEHRQLATSDIALSAVSQQAVASIESQLNLFTTCQTLAYYQNPANVQLLPSAPGSIPAGYTPTLTNVQYWNTTTASFDSGLASLLPSTTTPDPNCKTAQPQEITITITHNSETFTNSFVVDYPLAGATTQSGAGAATQLVFTTPPSTTAFTSLAFSQQPVLTILDASNNVVTTDLSPVIIQIVSGPSGAISGCAGSEVNGVVTFTGCELSQAGTYTIQAVDGNLVSTTNPTITVSGSTTPYLVFTTPPIGGASGSPLSQEPVIKVYLAGVPDVLWSGTIHLSTSGGVWPSGSPCSTLTVLLGVVTVPSTCTFQGGYYYDPVSNETLPIPYTMSVTGTGLIPATSITFSVSGAGTATQLVFATQPSGVSAASASATFATQPVVDIEDTYGNVVTTSSASVTMTLNSNSFGASLSGCTSTTTKGVATFSGCALNAYGTGFTLKAASSGLPSVSSSPFNITGLAFAMQFTTQPAAGASGSTLPTEPVLTIYDSHGYVVTASTTPITLTASGGSLTLCSNLTPYAGVITVETCNFAGTVGTNYTLTAAQGAVSVTSNPISPTVAGVPTQLAFTSQPVGGVAGSPLTSEPVVKVEDSAGNVVLISSATISLSVTPLTGTLSSCGDLQAVAGVVNVEDCVFGGVLGTQYQMSATSGVLNPATSLNFSVTAAGPIEQIMLSGCASPILWNANCTVTATAEDAWTNLAITYSGSIDSINFAPSGGGGDVTGLTTVTALNGVASDTVTGSVVGTVQITATAPTAPPVVSSPLTIIVDAIPQTITFTSTAPVGTIYSVTNSQSYSVAATGGTSGNAVTFSIDAASTSGCSVSGTTVLYGVGAGTCIIDANQLGNAHYLAAPQVQQSFTIAQAAQTIAFTSTAPASATYSVTNSQSYPVVAIGGASGNAVTFSIDGASTSGCTVTGSTVKYGGALGTCVIDAIQAGNANYLAAPQVQQSFTITQAAQTIAFTSTAPASATYSVTNSQSYTVVASGGASGNAVTFSIDGASTSGCTVTGSTVKYGGALGTCIIDANQLGNVDYLAAPQVQQNFTVHQATQTIAFTSTAPASATYSVTNSQSYPVVATGGASGNAVTFSIDGASSSGCTVSGSTVKYGGALGTCIIDANQAGNVDYLAASQVQQNFTVHQANQTIAFTSTAPASATYSVTNSQSYTVAATGGASGNAVTFSIDGASSSGCTVSGTTVQYGVGVGTCIIDANQLGNVDYLAASQVQQSFTVHQATQTIAFTSTAPASATYLGVNSQSYTVAATGGASGNAVTFSIDGASTSGCTITLPTTVRYGVGAGTCIIDANQAGNGNYLAAPQVQQSFSVAQVTQTIAFTSTAPASATYLGVNSQSYTVAATGGASGNAVTFSIDGASTSGCTITLPTTVRYGVGAGTCIIDANQLGNGNYLAAPQVQQSFSVAQVTQTIAFTSTAPASATYSVTNSQSYPVVASGGASGNAVTFSIDGASTSGCTVTGSTVKYGGALGTCVIDANQLGNANYLAAPQVQQSFTITQATQTIAFTSTAPASLTYSVTNSQSYIVAATGGASGNAVIFSIDGASTSGCTVTGSTVKYGGALGTCIIDANQAGNVDYLAAPQVQQSFTSTKYWANTSTGSQTVLSPAFTAPPGEPVLILVTNESISANRTCNTPAGTAALSGVTSLLLPTPTYAWYSTGEHFLMCAYYGKGTNVTNGTVKETFASGTTLFASIQVIELTGDYAATFNLAQTDIGASTTEPSWLLSGAPPAVYSEFLFGALTNGTTTLPTWNAISAFSSLGSLPISSGTTKGYTPTVYFGNPSTPIVTGTLSTATAAWGTIGIEVTP
jgi:hypothetical protein